LPPSYKSIFRNAAQLMPKSFKLSKRRARRAFLRAQPSAAATVKKGKMPLHSLLSFANMSNPNAEKSMGTNESMLAIPNGPSTTRISGNDASA